jgi:hypothetical protein
LSVAVTAELAEFAGLEKGSLGSCALAVPPTHSRASAAAAATRDGSRVWSTRALLEIIRFLPGLAPDHIRARTHSARGKSTFPGVSGLNGDRSSLQPFSALVSRRMVDSQEYRTLQPVTIHQALNLVWLKVQFYLTEKA